MCVLRSIWPSRVARVDEGRRRYNNTVPGHHTPKKTASAQPKQESLSSVHTSQLFRYNPTSSNRAAESVFGVSKAVKLA